MFEKRYESFMSGFLYCYFCIQKCSTTSVFYVITSKKEKNKRNNSTGNYDIPNIYDRDSKSTYQFTLLIKSTTSNVYHQDLEICYNQRLKTSDHTISQTNCQLYFNNCCN